MKLNKFSFVTISLFIILLNAFIAALMLYHSDILDEPNLSVIFLALIVIVSVPVISFFLSPDEAKWQGGARLFLLSKKRIAFAVLVSAIISGVVSVLTHNHDFSVLIGLFVGLSIFLWESIKVIFKRILDLLVRD